MKNNKATEKDFIDLRIKKIKPPKTFINTDIERYEAIQFTKALSEDLNLAPGVRYKIVKLERNKLNVHFIGKLKEQGEKHIRLVHKFGHSETFLKWDLITGECFIKEA